jgi:hypothetical protein
MLGMFLGLVIQESSTMLFEQLDVDMSLDLSIGDSVSFPALASVSLASSQVLDLLDLLCPTLHSRFFYPSCPATPKKPCPGH